MLNTFLAIILCLCIMFLIEKRKYKVRHFLYTVVFFLGAFLWAAMPNSNLLVNKVIMSVLFLFGVWHLTKACFFIDTDEIKKENS